MSKFKTKYHGYNDDEVKSALQKDIRRGLEDKALYWAFELAYEGKSSFGWLRNRLKIIAYEDIGLANPDLVKYVSQAVNDMDFYYQNDNKEWEMALAYIILLLCRSPKSRLVDHYKVTMKKIWELKKRWKETDEIPDYALDYHTSGGNKLGRHKYDKNGVEHFINEGEKLVNEVKLEDSEFWKKQAHKFWRSKYDKIIEKTKKS